MSPFQRHIDACNTGHDTRDLLRVQLGQTHVGFIAPALAAALPGSARGPQGVVLPRPEALQAAAAALAAAGHLRRRGEAFDVRETASGPVLRTLARGALRALGVIGRGVPLKGLVRGPRGEKEGLRLWVGIRSASKAVAPGQLDNLVAGGIPAGLSPEQCLVKEAMEEASLPPALARQ